MEQSDAVILVVEDEEIARKNMVLILKKDGHRAIAVESGEKALNLIGEQMFDLVITDLKMPGADGMAVLSACQRLQPYTGVIMVTGYATIESAVKAMKLGAYHYIVKPLKVDALRKLVSEALFKRSLQLENRELKKGENVPQSVPHLVGKSREMEAVFATIRQIATADTNVLIFGESGTGKELAAQAIHDLSGRANKRFVAFNCGSLTEDLMANELFGHEKGAFTGADRRQAGLVETADGGTVFLDEVGDMPPSMQVKLLRTIQEKVLMRVGGVDPVAVDVRFIAATHRDLQTDVEQGVFRQDLFYRLNVISIRMPPLAERDGDIPLLAYFFLEQKSKSMNKSVTAIEPAAMEMLLKYAWPGNVRELENVIERSVALSNKASIGADDLPEYLVDLPVETYRRRENALPSLEEQEQNYIRWVLEKCEGNKTRAAKVMGIDRVSLWRKMKKYGME